MISFCYRDGAFSSFISFCNCDGAFSSLISFCNCDGAFSSLISFYYRPWCNIFLLVRLPIFAQWRSREIQVNLRNPTKFTKTRKIPRNLVKILSNRCLYNIFETYFSYWGYLLAVNLQIFLETLSLKRANNVPKLPGAIMLRKTGH